MLRNLESIELPWVSNHSKLFNCRKDARASLRVQYVRSLGQLVLTRVDEVPGKLGRGWILGLRPKSSAPPGGS